MSLLFERWRPLGEPFNSNNAQIYRAEDTTGVLPGELAVKVLERVDRTERFEQEVRALAALSKLTDLHPSIIRLLEFHLPEDGASDRPYLVTPWMPGGDARTRGIHLKQYAGDIDAALTVLLPVTRAIDFLHKQRLAAPGYVAHRDIKPANILFDQHQTPLLTDFGCAYYDQRVTATVGEMVGSFAYAAPEMLNGRYEGDLRPADVYSLAVVLYAFLAGEDPPGKANLLDPEWNLANRFANPRLLQVNALIAACVSTNPTERPSAEALASEFTSLLQNSPGTSPPKLSGDLRSRLGLLRNHPDARGRLQHEERATTLGHRVRVLASKTIDRWKQSADLVSLQSAEMPEFLIEADTEHLGPMTVYNVLRHISAAEHLIQHPKLKEIHSANVEGGSSAWLLLTPCPELRGILPIIRAHQVFLVPTGTSQVRVMTLVWALIPETGWTGDYICKPITFAQPAESPSWDVRVSDLADKTERAVLDCIEWGVSLTSEGLPLPVAREPWRVQDVEVEPPTEHPLQLRHSRGPWKVLNETDGDLTVSASGRIGIRIGAPLMIFDLGNSTRTRVSGPIAQGYPSLSPNGSELVISGTGHNSSGSLRREVGAAYLISLQTGETRFLTYQGMRSVGCCAWSPDGREITVPLGPVGRLGPSLVSIATNCQQTRELLKGRAGVHDSFDQPVWAADGSKLYFIVRGAEEGIWVIDFHGNSQMHCVIKGKLTYPSVSPDGTMIAYLNLGDGRHPDYGVFVSQADGSNPCRIGYGNGSVAWAPDGSGVFFVQREKGHAQHGLWFVSMPPAPKE